MKGPWNMLQVKPTASGGLRAWEKYQNAILTSPHSATPSPAPCIQSQETVQPFANSLYEAARTPVMHHLLPTEREQVLRDGCVLLDSLENMSAGIF